MEGFQKNDQRSSLTGNVCVCVCVKGLWADGSRIAKGIKVKNGHSDIALFSSAVRI